MRVLKTTQAYYPFLDAGGLPVKVRAIAHALVERGYPVTVLTTDLGLAGRELPGIERGQGGVEVVYLRPRARFHALTTNPGVVGFCRKRLADFALVHIYGLYDLIGPVVARYCRRQSIPYVVEPMGMFRPIVRSLRLKWVYHRLFGEAMLRGARRLIATAEQERQELIEGGIPESKIVVRRNGVEVPQRLPLPGAFRRKWNVSADARVVLFLGRVVPKKSPELLLEAFARWRQEAGSKPSLLVLAGPDEGASYRQNLQTLAARLGLNGGVLFTGPLYDDAKWEAYRDADVFVLPSQNENFGNAAAEAVACGTPVIVTDRCGIAPLVDQRAGLVVPHDAGALQASLARLLEDEPLRRRLQAGCDEVARSLSWQEPLAELERLYAELVAEARAGEMIERSP